MKNGIAIASLLTALLALPAFAQTTQGMGGMGGMGGAGMGPGMGGGMQQRQARDCSKATNPEACTAHQEARSRAAEACRDKKGAERRTCYHEQMQAMDCSKAGNPQQCEARKQAYADCKGEGTRQGFKQCVQQKMPPADCTKAQDPARCEQHSRAREACKDKLGDEHRACLREMLAPSK